MKYKDIILYMNMGFMDYRDYLEEVGLPIRLTYERGGTFHTYIQTSSNTKYSILGMCDIHVFESKDIATIKFIENNLGILVFSHYKQDSLTEYVLYTMKKDLDIDSKIKIIDFMKTIQKDIRTYNENKKRE